jgi:hypothetical protein
MGEEGKEGRTGNRRKKKTWRIVQNQRRRNLEKRGACVGMRIEYHMTHLTCFNLSPSF